jgi:hypothetical protein
VVIEQYFWLGHGNGTAPAAEVKGEPVAEAPVGRSFLPAQEFYLDVSLGMCALFEGLGEMLGKPAAAVVERAGLELDVRVQAARRAAAQARIDAVTEPFDIGGGAIAGSDGMISVVCAHCSGWAKFSPGEKVISLCEACRAKGHANFVNCYQCEKDKTAAAIQEKRAAADPLAEGRDDVDYTETQEQT